MLNFLILIKKNYWKFLFINLEYLFLKMAGDSAETPYKTNKSFYSTVFVLFVHLSYPLKI